MASSQKVGDIRHLFAVYILITHSIYNNPVWPGVTRGFPVGGVMSYDHDLMSGTFLQSQYLSISYTLLQSRCLSAEYSDMVNVLHRNLIFTESTTRK